MKEQKEKGSPELILKEDNNNTIKNSIMNSRYD